jgi:hypothetical protein
MLSGTPVVAGLSINEMISGVFMEVQHLMKWLRLRWLHDRTIALPIQC